MLFTSRSLDARVFTAVVLTAAISLPLGAALAKGKGRAYEVRSPASLCTLVASHGKARVTPLAEGNNAWIGRLEIAPGAAVPEHRDPTEEYIHVVSGSGTMWINDTQHEVGPGSTVFMPANAKVRFANGKASMTAVQVFAGPGPAAKYSSWKGCP
jgi:quercetin dioxygenase-like cupin family protein